MNTKAIFAIMSTLLFSGCTLQRYVSPREPGRFEAVAWNERAQAEPRGHQAFVAAARSTLLAGLRREGYVVSEDESGLMAERVAGTQTERLRFALRERSDGLELSAEAIAVRRAYAFSGDRASSLCESRPEGAEAAAVAGRFERAVERAWPRHSRWRPKWHDLESGRRPQPGKPD